MSVPVWKRKLSSAEYVFQTYRLNKRLGEILMNKPQKYKTNYADHIIKTAMSALEDLQVADSIFVSKYIKENDFMIRRKHLLEAKGKIQHVATACEIYLEIVRQHDYAKETLVGEFDRFLKIYDQELEIGTMCETCHNLIKGVIESDNEIYKKYIKPAKD